MTNFFAMLIGSVIGSCIGILIAERYIRRRNEAWPLFFAWAVNRNLVHQSPTFFFAWGWIYSLWSHEAKAERACHAITGDRIGVLTLGDYWEGEAIEVLDFVYGSTEVVAMKLGGIPPYDQEYFAHAHEAGRCFAVRANFKREAERIEWPGHPMKAWHIG